MEKLNKEAGDLFVSLSESEFARARSVSEAEMRAALEKGTEERRAVEQVMRPPVSSTHVMFS